MVSTLTGPTRLPVSPLQDALSPALLGAAPLTQMRASPAPNSPPWQGDERGSLHQGRVAGDVSGRSLLQLKCSIVGNAQSPGQLQTPFFIMIFFSLSLLIKPLKFYLHLTMDKNPLKHLISRLQEVHRSPDC